MRGRRIVLLLITTLVMVGLPSGASAKAVGGCPTGYELVTVESLGLTPEEATGIPSLDGNRDTLTCIMFLPVPEGSHLSGAFVFRDNTVRPG